MGSGKLISFWSGESGTGGRTLARALAQYWAEQGMDVLLIDNVADHPVTFPEPASWIPRFRSLSPVMLRNYLAGPCGTFPNLNLGRLPVLILLKELLELAVRAYSWTLVIGPNDLGTEALPILDASARVLWVGEPGPKSSVQFQEFLDQLAKFHFPHAFAEAVINHFPEDSEKEFRFQQYIQELAHRLELQQAQGRPDQPQASAEDSPEKVIEELRQRVQPELIKALEETPQLEPAAAQQTVEVLLAQDASLPASRETRGEILSRVLDDVLGLGPIEPLLKDPSISEVMVNGPRCIYIEKKGKLQPAGVQFSSEKQLRTIIDRIVAPIGRRVDESMPLCDARLADGSRVNIVLPPLALDGASITIRKFSARALGFEDLVGFNSLSPAMANFLRQVVVGRRNIVVSGGTGSGKTTLLNALSSAIPQDERIVTIEDAAELRLQKPHVVRLESRPPNAEGEGAIPIRRLVINALRMRPDRIVVGECRGGEALDMLQAMNTGHDGSMTTVHANTPRDALGRIETLVLMAGMDLPIRVVREQIRSAVNLVVQQARLVDGTRKVISITEVTGMEGDLLTTQELFRFHGGGFESTGLVPKFSPS